MPERAATVVCRTPTPGKQPTRISKAKYDAVRKAILKVVPRRKDGVPFGDLPRLVGEALPAAVRRDLGSLKWYVTTVKLELEVRGEIERVPAASPQRLRRVG